METPYPDLPAFDMLDMPELFFFETATAVEPPRAKPTEDPSKGMSQKPSSTSSLFNAFLNPTPPPQSANFFDSVMKPAAPMSLLMSQQQLPQQPQQQQPAPIQVPPTPVPQPAAAEPAVQKTAAAPSKRQPAANKRRKPEAAAPSAPAIPTSAPEDDDEMPVPLGEDGQPDKRQMNKLAADRYRRKKREQFEKLREDVDRLTRENAALNSRCDKYKEEVEYLKSMLAMAIRNTAPVSPMYGMMMPPRTPVNMMGLPSAVDAPAAPDHDSWAKYLPANTAAPTHEASLLAAFAKRPGMM